MRCQNDSDMYRSEVQKIAQPGITILIVFVLGLAGAIFIFVKTNAVIILTGGILAFSVITMIIAICIRKININYVHMPNKLLSFTMILYGMTFFSTIIFAAIARYNLDTPKPIYAVAGLNFAVGIFLLLTSIMRNIKMYRIIGGLTAAFTVLLLIFTVLWPIGLDRIKYCVDNDNIAYFEASYDGAIYKEGFAFVVDKDRPVDFFQPERSDNIIEVFNAGSILVLNPDIEDIHYKVQHDPSFIKALQGKKISDVCYSVFASNGQPGYCPEVFVTPVYYFDSASIDQKVAHYKPFYSSFTLLMSLGDTLFSWIPFGHGVPTIDVHNTNIPNTTTLIADN